MCASLPLFPHLYIFTLIPYRKFTAIWQHQCHVCRNWKFMLLTGTSFVCLLVLRKFLPLFHVLWILFGLDLENQFLETSLTYSCTIYIVENWSIHLLFKFFSSLKINYFTILLMDFFIPFSYYSFPDLKNANNLYSTIDFIEIQSLRSLTYCSSNRSYILCKLPMNIRYSQTLKNI